jgi:hypothetical protein
MSPEKNVAEYRAWAEITIPAEKRSFHVNQKLASVADKADPVKLRKL